MNGSNREVEAGDPDVPLLYVLRNDLGLTGTHFGCGLAQCGACTVLVAGRAVRSCVTPARSVAGQEVTTIEGLGHARPARRAPGRLHRGAGRPVRLLHGGHHHEREGAARHHSAPDRQQVCDALAGNLCRCGSHDRVIRAVLRAAGNPGGR